MMWLAALLLPTIALLFFLGRYNEAAARRDWDAFLGADENKLLDRFADHVRLDGDMAQTAFDGAVRAHGVLDEKEATRLLVVAYGVLVEATQDRLVRLRGMAVCARMVTAFVPIAPLRGSGLSLLELRSLAGAGEMLHHLLVGGRERFALRCAVLGCGLRLALRSMRRAKDRFALDAFDAARVDWRTLDEEHVQNLRVLLLSRSAHPRARVYAILP